MSQSTRFPESSPTPLEGLPEILSMTLPCSLLDMAVTRGPVGPAPVGLAHGGALWRGQRGLFWIEIPEVARYLVEDGERLTIEPLAGADLGDVARFAASTPSAAAFLQRGLPVLHAAVAHGPGGAVMLAGDSSAGKSVLLASLLARGWRMLCDDMATLSLGDGGTIRVLPVSDDVHLWPDAAALIEPVRPGRLTAEPVPLDRVWLLGTANEPDVKTIGLAGLQRFSALTAAAYNSRIAAALLDRRANLHLLGELANSDIPIRRLIRPRGRWTAEALAEAVVSDAG